MSIITQKTASDIVRSNYSEYGRYINIDDGRVVCYEADGLKSVQRRTLYATYMVAKDSLTKTARVVGEAMGKFHPHGDSSIAGCIEGMVRDGLMYGKGNFGSNVGLDPIEAAATRYTECMLDPKILKLAFKYIDDVPYFVNDLGFKEPEYLPTPFPLNICHLTDYETFVYAIGFCIAFYLPKFKIEDLLELIRNPKKTNVNLQYRTLEVQCPNDLFTKGTGVVETCARYVVASDNKSFNVLEFPLMKNSPRGLLSSFKDAVLTDLSKDTTNVEVSLPRGKTVNDYDLNKLLKGKLKCELIFHNKQTIRHYSLPEIVETTYSYYKKAIETHLNKSIQSLKDKIDLTNWLIKMKPHLNPMNDKTRDRVKKKLGISDELTDKLMQYNIKQICNAEKKLQDTEDELKATENNLNHLDSFCISEIEECLK